MSTLKATNIKNESSASNNIVLISDVNILSNQLTSKRELLLKVQGAIEYLQQTGTTLPEPEKKEEETEESPEKQ